MHAKVLKRPSRPNTFTAVRPASTCSIAIAPTNTIFSENHSRNVVCRKINAVPVPMAMNAAGDVITT